MRQYTILGRSVRQSLFLQFRGAKAPRISSSSKHIPHPSKHVQLSAGPGAATPNLLPRAGKAGPEERSAMIAVLHILRGYLLRCQCLCVLIASVPSEGVHEGRLVRKNNAPWQSGAHICQVVARRMCIVSLLYMGVRGSLCNACRCGRYAVAITLPQGARIAWPPFESFHGGMLLHRSRDPRSPASRD